MTSQVVEEYKNFILKVTSCIFMDDKLFVPDQYQEDNYCFDIYA